MKLVAPNYYKEFRCIADKCRHSCCIGWEIDIDDRTLQFYRSVGGEFGKRLQDNITEENDTAHFCLKADERCPFLNDRGLCDIITTLGEAALCQICDDHPRYRNFYSDREEIGVGLSCEAAAQLVLSQREKMQLVSLDDGDELLWEEECEFIALRQKLWDMLQNREKAVEKRIEDVFAYCGIKEISKTPQQWARIYKNLERLDDVWGAVLEKLEKADTDSLNMPCDIQTETAFEQLMCYFTYRHLSDSLDDGRFVARLMFCVQSYRMIKWIAALHYSKYESADMETLSEIVRIYSAEIEYSTENIETLLDIFEE